MHTFYILNSRADVADVVFVIVGAYSGSYSGIRTSPDGVKWSQRVNPSGNTLNGVCYGNSMFCAVGAGGTILTSSDGKNWTQQTSGTSNSLSAVAYGDGIFVAVGASGTILTSSDGVSWTTRTSGTTNLFNAIVYGSTNDLWAAVGASGEIRTSPDGTTWTSRSYGGSANIRAVCFDVGAGRYMAYTANSGEYITSTNGTSWSASGPTSFTSFAAQGCVFADGVALAVGFKTGANIQYTTTPSNYTTWTSAGSIGSTLQAVAYSASLDLFVCVGLSGACGTSPDGITWTDRPLPGGIWNGIAAAA